VPNISAVIITRQNVRIAPLPFITDFESPNVAKGGKIEIDLLIILFIVMIAGRGDPAGIGGDKARTASTSAAASFTSMS
jgi:hypothetical protein